MGKQYLIASEPLTEEGFAPYGEAILLPTPPRPSGARIGIVGLIMGV